MSSFITDELKALLNSTTENNKTISNNFTSGSVSHDQVENLLGMLTSEYNNSNTTNKFKNKLTSSNSQSGGNITETENIESIIKKSLNIGKLNTIIETTTDYNSVNLSNTSTYDGGNQKLIELLNQKGGSFNTFQKNCVTVADKFNVSNNAYVKKITKHIQTDIKEKNPNITDDELIHSFKELLDNNNKISHYKEIMNNYKKEKKVKKVKKEKKVKKHKNI